MEINRILKRETGVLLLSTPNLCSLRNRLNFLGGRIDRVIENPFVSFLKARRVGHLGHCRLYAPTEVEAMLTLLGYRPMMSFARYQQYQATPANAVEEPISDRGRRSSGPSAARKLVRKFVRSPWGYLTAIQATALAAVEKVVPRFRPQIYVVATKVNDAEFDKNYPKELHELVMSNRLSRSR
jgi:hypothetical protein